MRVITLAGSPRFPSRSSSLLEYAREKLNGLDVEVYHWNLQNFVPEDLLYARFDSPALKTFTEQLQQADGLIVATPVYKAAYSGALKTLLDLLPERALQGKVVLPLATGGTVAHLLAVDYALKPVLSTLKAQEILHGVRALAHEVEKGKLKAKDISEQMLSDQLYTKGLPDPDLIIRPSGEYRLSNFLLWQSAYAELWFSDVLWPDFTEENFVEALRAYEHRNRRFGGV